MFENQTKYQRLEVAVNKWRLNKGIGTIILPKGFDSIYTSLHFIAQPHLSKALNNEVVIVTTSELRAKQWYNYITTHIQEKDQFKIKVYNLSYILENVNSIICTLAIFDGKESQVEELDGILEFTYWLAISDSIENAKFGTVVDTITEEEAISNNWISSYKEYNYLIELSDEDKNVFIRETNSINDVMKIFKGIHTKLIRSDGGTLFESDFKTLHACVNGANLQTYQGYWVSRNNGEICKVVSSILNIDINDCYNYANTYLNATRSRITLLNSNTRKLEAINEICNTFNKPIICFNSNTTFAEEIANYINDDINHICYPSVLYHSKLESRSLINPVTMDYYRYSSGSKKGEPKMFGIKSLRDRAVNGIKNSDFKFLSTGKSLADVEINNVNTIISTFHDTNPYSYNPGNNTSINIINILFNDFVDEKGNIISTGELSKLNTRQFGSGVICETITNLNDIT